MEVSKSCLIFVIFAFFNFVECCIFDSVVDKNINIPKVYVNYRNREKRSPDRFAPLRFHVHNGDEKNKLSTEINKVVVTATTKVSELLQVNPVEGPILLERTSCLSTWTQGPNKGRCSSLRARPKEELCENKIDGFQIPREHLQDLAIYNYSGSDPILTLPAGRGIQNADYVLYVKSKYTSMCEQGDIQAYASYCRLDQFGRPIAGFINFCPSPSRKKAFDVHYFLNIAVHEIFHALGFSRDLFPYYSGCAVDSFDCDHDLKRYLSTDSHGVPRIIFPSVAREMKQHFSCVDEEFGGPLEVVNRTATSHWDPLLLYGSIMMSSMDEPEYVSVDRITLATLADSGWYRVNYQKADKYFWGQGEGCLFGLKPDCQTKENILCNVEDSVPGCDMMHYSQAKCEKVSPAHYCGVFKPDSSADCRGKVVEFHDQHLHHLRCFSMEVNGKALSKCAAYHCTSTGELSVLMGEAWITCSINDSVTLFSETLLCPRSDIICSGEDHMLRDKVHLHSISSADSFSHFNLFAYFLVCSGFSAHLLV